MLMSATLAPEYPGNRGQTFYHDQLIVPRFGNYLRNNCLAQANSLDLSVIELATKAIARLTQVSGTYTANLKFDFIDHEVKKAFEWLSAPERNEGQC